ncbi:hypothetical protein CERSUDRAFT_100428 [Gelatoporia subvermispora B]|uniref:Uncharacterized protein n=1 Tax=Ceriporiopsis subvermispora (strain B) TaxID=914234 RepID=M2Q3N7_CERS8|nr:hypothetical protein CERSUDRAFT_100428 [Gelatoporia subvermispora B]
MQTSGREFDRQSVCRSAGEKAAKSRALEEGLQTAWAGLGQAAEGPARPGSGLEARPCATLQAPHQKGTGKLTKSDSDFSVKNWGGDLATFMATAEGLQPEQLLRIARLAEAMARKEGRTQPSAGHVTAVNSAGVKDVALSHHAPPDV